MTAALTEPVDFIESLVELHRPRAFWAVLEVVISLGVTSQPRWPPSHAEVEMPHCVKGN